MKFVHCDPRILHAPKICKFCDEHPDWQELREAWNINFTGEHDPTKTICPAEAARSLENIERWGNNRPFNNEDNELIREIQRHNAEAVSELIKDLNVKPS